MKGYLVASVLSKLSITEAKRSYCKVLENCKSTKSARGNFSNPAAGWWLAMA
jgi:hypothetical protein